MIHTHTPHTHTSIDRDAQKYIYLYMHANTGYTRSHGHAYTSSLPDRETEPCKKTNEHTHISMEAFTRTADAHSKMHTHTQR